MLSHISLLALLFLFASSLRSEQLGHIVGINIIPHLLWAIILSLLFLIGTFFRRSFQVDVIDFVVGLIVCWYFSSAWVSGCVSFSQMISPALISLTYITTRLVLSGLVGYRGLGIALLGIVVIVLLQLFLLERVFYDLPYPYFGFFENYATLSIFLAAAYPFVFTLTKGKVARIILSTIILGVVLYYSRTAFLSLALAVFIYMAITQPIRRLFVYVTIAFVSVVCLLVVQNVDSISGRLLVWKILWNGIESASLWLGNGSGFVERYYLDLQSYYFSVPRPIDEQLLAGQVHSSFNEYIRLFVEQGIIGLILVGVLLYLLFREFSKSLRQHTAIFISLVTLVISATFSFPASSLTICLLATLLCACRTEHKQVERHVFNPIVSVTSLVAGLSVLLYVARHAYIEGNALQQWRQLKSGNYVVYNEGLFIKESEKLYPYIMDNAPAVHEYAAYLFRMGLYEEALNMALRGKGLYANLNIYLLLASLYEKLGDTDQAEGYYIHAINMVPKLLMPKYLLFNLYKESDQPTKARSVANTIQSFPIKVDTPEAREIKEQIDNYLHLNILNYD